MLCSLHPLIALLSLGPLSPGTLSAQTPTEVASAAPNASLERQGTVMGTPWTLTLTGTRSGDERPALLLASEGMLLAMEATEQRLSNWSPDSELSRWNRSQPDKPWPCSPALVHELQRAEFWRQQTDSAFSPLMGPLIIAWDLRGAGRVPSPAELASALECSQPNAWIWMQGQPVRQPGAQVASGGFGKGAALHAALMSLAAARPSDLQSVLNLGGQVAVRGITEQVAIAHPRQRSESVATWTLDSGSLATSGNSERARLVEEQSIGHLLDARTGRPAPDFGSVTVWCENALDADCLSTALFVLGPEAGLKWASQTDGVRALFVEKLPSGIRLRATADCRPFLTSNTPILWFEPQTPKHTSSTPQSTQQS